MPQANEFKTESLRVTRGRCEVFRGWPGLLVLMVAVGLTGCASEHGSAGTKTGILDKQDRVHADRALIAVLRQIDREGVVHGVSDGTPMGHDLDFYRRIPNLPTPYGQALTMLLLIDVLLEEDAEA